MLVLSGCRADPFHWLAQAVRILVNILKCDFEPISGWECLFFHRRLKLFLSVYVDDFKLVGEQGSMKEGWELLTRSG